jgi:YD repeat-containing protein
LTVKPKPVFALPEKAAIASLLQTAVGGAQKHRGVPRVRARPLRNHGRSHPRISNTLTATSSAAGLISSAAPGLLPGLGFLLAVESGDPVSIVSSGMTFLAAVNPAVFGFLGPIGIAIAIFGAILASGRDIPTIEGEVQASWNDDGQLSSQVVHDAKGGGQQAQGVFQNLLDGFNQGLDSYNASAIQQMAELHMQGANGHASDNQALQWALNPSLIPQVGYYYDPDGSQREITLTFTNEQGEEVTQRYDLEGNRINAVGLPMGGPNLGEAFGQQTQGAMAPSWLIDGARIQYTPLTQEAAQLEAQMDDLAQEITSLAPWSTGGDAGQDYPSPNPERYAQAQAEFAALQQQAWQLRDEARQVLNSIPEQGELYQAPQVSQDGLQQSLQALTLMLGQADATNASPSTGHPVLANLDGDAYLEQVNWVQNNQALLGDENGAANEPVFIQEPQRQAA